MQIPSDLFLQKARQIKVLLSDVDGVMTDGTLSFFTDAQGHMREIKHFESLDGMGLMYLAYCGIKTGIISRGDSPTLASRAKELAMDFVFYNISVKHRALAYLEEKYNILPQEVAFIGDDLIDLGVMERVGLPLSVANGVPEVRAGALYVSPCSGGHGAVRDIAQQILRARGQWESVVQANRQGTFANAPKTLHIVKDL